MDNETTPPGIQIPTNAAVLDPLASVGRLLVIIAGALPLLVTLFGKRDVVGFINYLASADGATTIAAVTTLATMAWGVWKARHRGRQVVSIAGDTRTPNDVAVLK